VVLVCLTIMSAFSAVKLYRALESGTLWGLLQYFVTS